MTTALALVVSNSLALVPLPVSVKTLPGTFHLTAETTITSDEATQSVADRFRDFLSPATGFRFPNKSRGGTVSIAIDPKLNRLGREGYSLQVRPTGVEIRSAGAAGCFYAVQTLRQLLPSAVYRKALSGTNDWPIPCVEIEDSPRFAWRGAHLDVARHFMPKEFILKFLDVMAVHKLNTFHWHLTDDQGWRIEIKRHPRLTEVGAFRKDSMLRYSPAVYEGKPHGGYYSQEDVREVVSYASERHITVVPEIEMPGHAQAAIAAYPELGNTDQKLEVATTWGVVENVFNPEDSTIEFLKDVLTEVMALFPSRFLHVGGDEVPKKQWQENPHAQAKMKLLGLKTEHELQSWFVKQMDAFLTQNGRRLIGWDEILEGGLAPGATVMSWRGTAGGIAAAKAGHDVVMAPTSHTYLDYYQSREREREPWAIGGFLPLETVYSFDPMPDQLEPSEGRHVLGAQAQLWTEYIREPKHVEYMAYPRLSALAEVVWTAKSEQNYESFHGRLTRHLARLAALDVCYRPLDMAAGS